jgi:predicted dithiol-disulfide oxidoreductase (DUF899 family)
MTEKSEQPEQPEQNAPLPPITDRQSWQARLDELAVREKAHTREGDKLAAERRRLPMVEVDASVTVVGQKGAVPLLDVFEGRRMLTVYYAMWHDDRTTKDQCEGCTFFTAEVRELSYLHSRDVSYAIFSQGPYEQSRAYHDFLGWDVPWYSARDSAEQLLAGRFFGMRVSYLRRGEQVFETYWTTGRGVERAAPSYAILDETAYGRQETWEDSPEGWPRGFGVTGEQFRVEGRPTAQWVQLGAGKKDPF